MLLAADKPPDPGVFLLGAYLGGLHEVPQFKAMICSLFNFGRSTVRRNVSMLALDGLICHDYSFL